VDTLAAAFAGAEAFALALGAAFTLDVAAAFLATAGLDAFFGEAFFTGFLVAMG
jgi:hypothetical protein